jgi:hypothetical protein
MSPKYTIVPVPAPVPDPPVLSLVSCAVIPPTGQGEDETKYEGLRVPSDIDLSDLEAELVIDRGEPWLGGYGYLPRNSSAAINRALDDYTTTDDPFEPPNLDPVEFVPFAAFTKFTLTSLDYQAEDFEERINDQLDSAVPQAVEFEFWTGTIAQANDLPNNYLAGPNTVDVTPDPAVAASVEAAAAPSLPLTITTGTNDTFVLTSDNDPNSPDTFTIAPGTYSTIGALETAVANAESTADESPLSTYVTVTETGGKLVLTEKTRGTTGNDDTITDGNDGATAIGFTSPDFSGGTAGTAVSVLEGLGKLQTASKNLVSGQPSLGAPGMIHCMPEAVPNLLNSRLTGKYLLDMFGNIIVPGIGYPGTGPSVDAPAAGTSWMYFTDMVSVRVQKTGRIFPGSVAEALDRSQGGYPNTITFRGFKIAGATFDGARQFACLVSLPS